MPPYYPDQPRWVDIAESLKPTLRVTEALPRGLVEPVADAAAFQGWRMRPVEGLAALPTKALGAGEGFTLDFGEHVVGTFRMKLKAVGLAQDAPVRIKFIFAEVPAETAEPFDPYPGQLSRAWLQDEVVNVDVLPCTLRLPRRYAFRYVKIEVLATSPCFRVALADFACDTVTSADPAAVAPPSEALPPEFQELDRVSLRTLRNCMLTVFEDGPKRDRRLWLGDLRLQALTNYASFRNFALVKRCLYLFAGLAREDGLVASCVYEVPEPAIGHCFILDYAALFGPALLDYAEASGDWAAARELWPVALRQMDFVLAHVGADGLFVDPGTWWIFIDWHAGLEKTVSMHGLAVYALRRMLALAKALSEHCGTAAPGGAERQSHTHTAEGGGATGLASFPALIERMTVAARKAWRDASGLFASGTKRQISWASQAWMVLGGVLSPTEGAAALKALPGRADAIPPAGPYLYHHVVEAMLACGLRDEAVALLQSYWGGMLRAGATTFFEVYDPADDRLSPYRSPLINSYCHAWSCTPAYFIRKGFAPPPATRTATRT